MTRRRLRRASCRGLGVALVLGLGSAVGALSAGAAVPTTASRSAKVATTTIPPATTTTPPSTQAPVTTLPQASTDSTPTAQKTGSVASDPAQKRLRWIIGGLVGLAVIVLLATIWLWRATRPSSAVTATEVEGDGTTGNAPAGGWSRPAIPTAGGLSPDQLPLMAVTAPLPSAAAAATAADGPVAVPLVPVVGTPSPPPRSPADVYGTAPAPPDPPDVVSPDPHWFEEPEAEESDDSETPASEHPDAPRFEEPEPPRFERPDAPRFEDPPPTTMIDAVAGAQLDDSGIDARDEDDDEVEAWEPRTEPDPSPADGEQWRGIRPLGPVPRAE